MASCRVTEIVVDENGRATGVKYVKQRHEYFQPADVVLLSAYNYENIRLLLLSKSKAFPNGLGNNSGQVGKHYFSHNTGGGVNVTFPFELNLWYGMPAQGTGIDNWADDNFDHSGLDFIGGGLIWTYTGRSPMSTAAPPAGAPTWGSAWKSYVANNADRTPNIYLQKTTLPYEGNYVDLDPVYKDKLGIPVPRITGTYRANEAKLSAVHPAEGRAALHRSRSEFGNDRRPGHSDHADDAVHPRLRRHTDGRQPRDERRRSLGLLARMPQRRRGQRIGDGHERLPQPDRDHPSPRLAHRGAPGEKLEKHRRMNTSRGGPPRTVPAPDTET